MTYRLQDIFTAIADPNRRKILEYLIGNEMQATGIAARFAMSRAAVSKHLKVLHRSNLVTVKNEGRNRIYKLNAEPLTEVRDWVSQYEHFWDDRLKSLKKRIEDRV